MINESDSTMNSANQANRQQKPQNDRWPQKLNKALIAIGVIAFGLIITDRIIEMFSADDAPTVQAEVKRVEPVAAVSAVAQNIIEPASNALPAVATQMVAEAVSEPVVSAAVDATRDESLATSTAQTEPAVELQEIFGSRVVFVSASEPVYVVTEDDRRFHVGSEIDAQTTLAGVTAKQLILEQAGDLTIISLPDPVVQ